MKYKLVAIDMDGTLLNSDNQISERTRVAIEKAKEKGAHIVISTGRVLKSALYYSETLKLRNPIIACNGAIIVDESANVIYKKPIEKSLIKTIIDIAKHKNIYYHFYDESRFYSHVRVEEILKFYNEGSEKSTIDMEVFEDIEEIIRNKDLNVYKFIFIDDNKDNLQSLRLELDKIDNIGTSSSWINNIEAMGYNVSKGEAVKELCTRINIKPEEVIAIGDSENDLSMIRFAGLGVAMGNGDEIIKKEADYITDTNDEDGVAKIIEKFILE
ncbi:Cof-type HAD-IIB family hydrolase [Tissierella sp. MB52-C2]|uniref:Cof-type HAD-IIB family hydrolase n=1 Tax=Tissierella sp. MB52-C2 TaxID=3070999 RepID=UPI00280ADA8A|nr:Cof-type HAD-IIB family hydrolase [Tissierella sp. MB52-C2]WMM25787.1 Cof-type HAD-IIB family hydrolase [Tissierella sp. MB52-C2]